MFPEQRQLTAVRSGGGHQGTLLAFIVAFEASCDFNFTAVKWLLMRSKTLSDFFHSSDGGNSVKRLKLDTDHDEKNQGMS